MEIVFATESGRRVRASISPKQYSRRERSEPARAISRYEQSLLVIHTYIYTNSPRCTAMLLQTLNPSTPELRCLEALSEVRIIDLIFQETWAIPSEYSCI